MKRSQEDYIIWRNLYSKDQDHIFSYIPILVCDFHKCLIYTSAGINHEIRKRTVKGEQDFLRKGYQKILKTHETWSGKKTPVARSMHTTICECCHHIGKKDGRGESKAMNEFQRNGKHSSSLIYLKTSLIRFCIHLASCLQISSICNSFRRIKHEENPAAI